MNIWWLRRDLRLKDNTALSSALEGGSGVIPVFVLDEHLLNKPADNRHAFLFGGLRSLNEDLKRLGSSLVIRNGNPVEELLRLTNETGAKKIYAEEDVSPYAIRRDKAVGSKLDLHLVGGSSIQPVPAVVKPDGSPYSVFTPYMRKWKSMPSNDKILPGPTSLPPIPAIESMSLPETPISSLFPPGEKEANRRLKSFIDGPIFDYKDDRDRMDLEGTSALSPYLRFGMVSVRQVYSVIQSAIRECPDPRSVAGCETWLNELIWREFYQSILYHFPDVLKTSFRPSMRNIPWRDAPGDFTAWKTGYTGYPVVDAGMRQLNATGWMHNRARMITASFLTKHLLINWQDGERYFMQMLVDGDPAANNGGWQWVAGTGTDAAPYFRVFNPILQGKKFDPMGNYIRRWLPELSHLPNENIHTPWLMATEEQQTYQVKNGEDYPRPIVDHNYARQRVLNAYSHL